MPPKASTHFPYTRPPRPAGLYHAGGTISGGSGKAPHSHHPRRGGKRRNGPLVPTPGRICGLGAALEAGRYGPCSRAPTCPLGFTAVLAAGAAQPSRSRPEAEGRGSEFAPFLVPFSSPPSRGRGAVVPLPACEELPSLSALSSSCHYSGRDPSSE